MIFVIFRWELDMKYLDGVFCRASGMRQVLS